MPTARTVRVKFLKDDMTQTGDFSIVEIDGSKYGKIDFNKGVIRYAADRFLEIELVTNTVTGLKIPLVLHCDQGILSDSFQIFNKKRRQSGYRFHGAGQR